MENSLSPVAHALAVLTKGKFEELIPSKASPPVSVICPKCGTTAAHFGENHRFGCPECYKIFVRELHDILQKIQPASVHRGRIPAGKAQLAVLEEAIAHARNNMGRAIKNEDYEEAARLRDEIRRLNTMLSHSVPD